MVNEILQWGLLLFVVFRVAYDTTLINKITTILEDLHKTVTGMKFGINDKINPRDYN